MKYSRWYRCWWLIIKLVLKAAKEEGCEMISCQRQRYKIPNSDVPIKNLCDGLLGEINV